jgi:hypothetical protein
MLDAAGLVGLPFISQLKEGTHRLLNFCFGRMQMSMRKTSECCHVLLVADVDDADGHDYEQRLAHHLHHGCICLEVAVFCRRP